MVKALKPFVRQALTAFCLIFALSASAQFDTEFWMPPLWDTGNNPQNDPSQLFITSQFDNVDVHVETADGVSLVFDGVVSSGNPLTVPLTPALGQTTIPNQAVLSGLIVTASQPVQVAHRVISNTSQSLTVLKGESAIGRSFHTASQTRNNLTNNNPTARHFISVMALQDNTTITFETPFDLYTAAPGDLPNPYTITINANESYVVRSNTTIEHVSGGIVTSDKDIVCISGSTFTPTPDSNGNNGADAGTDQILPDEFAGSEFALVRGFNNGDLDYVIAVTPFDGTEIYLDGAVTPTAILNEGEFVDFTLTGTPGTGHSIVSSAPILLYQVSGASNDDEVDMTCIPALSCIGSRYIELSLFPDNVDQNLQLITSTDPNNDITINGISLFDLPNVILSPIPGLPDWQAATLPENSIFQDNVIESTDLFHAAWLAGTEVNGGYGFFSKFNSGFDFTDPETGLLTDIYFLATLCSGEAIDHCIEVFSCGEDHNIINFSGNDGAVVITPPTSPFDTCFRYTAPFNYSGFDTVTFTISNNLGYEGDLDIVFEVLNPDTPIDAGEPQELCSPVSVATLSAVNPDPSVDGFWTVLQGGSTLVDPNSPTTDVTNLSLGSNLFLWTQDYGCEVNTAITQIIVFDGTAPTANAGPDAELCSNNNSYVMQANSPGASAIGTWEVIQGNATITNINNPNALVTNIGIGVNIFEWNIDNGPCGGGASVDQMIITVYDQNVPAANAGADQDICIIDPSTTATVIANAVSAPAMGMWSLVSGSGTIADPTSSTTEISDIGIGENVFEWTIDNGPCGTTSDQIIITGFDEALAPAEAGPDAEYCSPVMSHQLSATPVDPPATGIWSVVSGTGTFQNPTNPNTTVSNLSIGENVYRWTELNGPCPGPDDFDLVTVTVYNQNLPAANAGPDQEYCSDVFTSAQLAASNAPFPAQGSWSVISGTGTFADSSSPTTTVSGLSVGDNVFEWTVDNGLCGTSSDQMTIVLYEPIADPVDAGADASYCTPNTSHQLQGSPVTYPSTGLWTVVSGSASFNNPTNPTTTANNLGIGENVLRWTVSNGVCDGVANFDEVTITIYNANIAPANAGPDQEFCSSLFTSADMAGNIANFPASGMWSVVSGSGTFTDPTDPNTSVSGLSLGENVFEWRISNGPCGETFDTVTIILFDSNQQPANAGPDVSFCTPTSTYVMQADPAVAPAQGTWTLVQGTGTINNVNNPTSSISGLGIGENIFRWTIDNGACPGEPNFDEISIFIYDENAPLANAGPDQEFCWSIASPTNAQMNASAPVFPGTGEWTLVSGIGTIEDTTDPNTMITSLGIGVNVFEWTITNGPCDPATSSDQVTIFVFDPQQQAANAGADIEICSDTPFVILNGNTPTVPASGTWTLTQGSGVIADPNSPNTAITGFEVGINTFTWTINNGPCNNNTSDTMSIIVYDVDAPVANAGPDQSICSDQSTIQLDASNSVFPGVGTWSVISGTGTFSNINDELATVSGLSVGENIFQWTIDNGPCPSGITTDNISIFVFDTDAPAANAGPDQSLCTPTTSTSLAGNSPIFPATGEWTLVSGSGTITDPTDPNTTVTGLGIGQNVFRWSIVNAPCIPEATTDQVIITVFDGTAPPANAGPDQEFCTPVSSANLAGNAAVAPGTGTWTLIAGTGTIVSSSNPNSQVTGLTVGENIFRWTISNGPCGVPTTDEVSIFIFDENQEDANAGTDQILCSPTSSTTLTGNSLTFPASGVWELVSGTGTIVDPTSPTTDVNGLSIGVNVFRWTVSNGPCSPSVSEDTVSILVYDSTAPPADAGADQESCTPNTTLSLSGNSPVVPATGTWTLVSGSGSIADPSDPNTTVSGLAVGENIFQWTINNGPCGAETTSDQVSIFIYSNNAPAANAGSDQNLCTPQISTFMNANSPVFPGSGEWVLVSGVGSITDPTDPNTEITGLGIGVNVFEWTISNGPCVPSTTSDTVTITVFDGGAPQAEAGPTQELCSPTSSTVLEAIPAVSPGTGIWTLSNGTGTVTDINDPESAVTGLSIGVNTFVWTLDYSTCGTQQDSVNIIVYDSNLPDVFAGDDQSFCAPINSTTMNANPITPPANGTWSLIQGSGTIADPNDPNTDINDLTVGENIFVWTMYNGGCSPIDAITDTVSIFIFDSVQLPANAGSDQEICTPNDQVTLNGNAVIFPAVGEWTLVSGTGTITDPSSPGTTVTGLSVGENIFEWSIQNGNCGTTTDQVSIFVYDQNNPPSNAGPDQELCTPSSSTFLAANTPIFPSIGTWTVINGTGTFADPNDPNTEVTGLSIGENIFRWSIDNGPCGPNSNNTVSVFLFDENAVPAAAGEDQELCFPQTSTTMNANDPTNPAVGTWSVIAGTASFDNVNSPQANVTGLSIGENILVWEIYNGPCAAPTTDTVTVFVFDPDNAPSNAGPDQALCSPDFDTNLAAVAPNIPAFGTWTLVSGTGTIADPNDPNSEVTGLSIGQNIFRWTVYNGPCDQGETIDQVSIFVFDENNPAADAGPDQNLCTPTTSATMAGSSLTFPATGVWEFVQGGGTIVNPGSPTTVINNLEIGINILSWTVNNGPCADGITVDQVIINVFDLTAPPAVAGDIQEFCFPVDVAFMDANEATGASIGTWTVVSGTGTFADPNDPNTGVTDLEIGSNIFEWTIDNGVCGSSSDQTSVLVYDPDAPVAFAGDDSEYCTPTSTHQMNALTPSLPGVGTWTLVQGSGTINNINSPGANVSGLTIGENIFRWTVYNGPCNEPTVDEVSIFIFDENHPDAEAGDDQELCLPDTEAVLNAEAAIFPAFGTWTVVQGTGTFADPNDPNTLVTDLSAGVNIFEWTIDNTPCANGITSDTVTINVFQEDAPDAEAGDDIELCSPISTTVLGATPGTPPQTGTWTLVSGSGIVSNPDDPNSIVSGLSVGVNVFQWTIYNGPCENDGSFDTVQVLVYDESAADANAGVDQELCLPETSTNMQATVPTVPATGTWTLVQGTGDIASPNDPNTLITNLSVGENIFEWTVSNGPCEDSITTDTVSIFVFDENAPLADAGPDQQICTPLSTVVMDALDPTSPQTGTWMLVSGSGTISDENDPNAIISGLTVGTNVFSWTIYNGPCENGSSIDTVTIEVFDENAPDADAGEDQELCLPDDSTTLTAAIPLAPATGVWTVVNGTGSFADPTDPNTVVTGLSVGTNTFEWTVTNGPCEDAVSSDTVDILVFTEDASPADAGPDLEICTPESCVTLQATTPDDPNTGIWTIISGSGTISDINDPNAEICALTVGQTVLQWRVINGPCTTGEFIDTVTISVYDQNAPAADAGEDQEICAPESSTAMSALTPTFPGQGTWELIQGTGTVEDVNDPQTTVNDLEIGISLFSWTVYNGPCAEATVDTVQITIFDPNSPNAAAGPDQFFCTPEASSVLTGNVPIAPATGTWTLISGSGVIDDPSDPQSAVSEMSLGENILIWQIYNGSCDNSLTTDTLSIFVNDPAVADADAGPDQFYCGPTDEIQMQGSETIGNTATGEWTIIEGTGTFANTANEFSLVFDLPVGVHTYVWTVDNMECGITSDTVSIFVYDPELEDPYAGEDMEICENEFEIFELNAVEPDYPAIGEWAILEGPVEISDPMNPNAEVLSLGTIDVPLGSTPSVLAWTVDNGICGTISDTLLLVLEDCLTIDIPDAFSPNRDLINDFWVIPNLESYPNNTVKIFNRWGALVYEASPYLSNWDGTSEHPSTIGSELPVSTYYYILDLGDGSEPFTGYVYLKR